MKAFINCLFLLIIWTSTPASAQPDILFIKTIPQKSINNTSDSVISYPIFRFGDIILSASINESLRHEFNEMYDLDPKTSIRNALNDLATKGLSEMSYEELLNDDKFFSFIISHEWIAAYPTYTESYFVFDKKTKNRITINELVLPGKRNDFKNYVISLWKDSITSYKGYLEEQLANGEIDSLDYSSARDYADKYCINSYSIKKFRLIKNTIEIIFDCGFPRVMRPLDPSGSVILPFKKIREYLKPKYRN